VQIAGGLCHLVIRGRRSPCGRTLQDKPVAGILWVWLRARDRVGDGSGGAAVSAKIHLTQERP